MAGVDLSRWAGAPGKKARLYRLFYQFGPGYGFGMFLPVDHGLEHGPVDFLPNPPSADPDYILRLALEGGYSAVVFQYGIASRYYAPFAGRLPLVLKVNGKTNIPPADEPISPLTSTVEDAVRLGADAVGYTLYVGSPRQDEDFKQFLDVRREAERLGMPVIVWAYPRGRYVDEKGGRDSLYAVEYAARVAAELGADLIKVNVPEFVPEKMARLPKPYDTTVLDLKEAIARVVWAAAGVPVLVSGGSKIGDEDLLARARAALEGGVVGIIFGRNIFQRPYDEAIRLSQRFVEMMRTVRPAAARA
jgi:class I fructose-bisphosphate aldolase